jgi:polyhydroxybutyrate depolymerase
LARSRARRLTTSVFAALALVGAVSTVSSASAGTRALAPGDHTFTFKAQGIARSFILHVPPGPVAAQRPLVLVYHGSRASAQGTIGVTDFEAESKRNGELVAFLQGVNDHWNQYSGVFGGGGINDVTYTLDVIHVIEAKAPFDHARIVAAGFSNGALMVESLGCQLAKTIAMVVPVEGQLTTSMVQRCRPARAIDVYEIHGTADATLAYNGGGFLGALSAPKSAAKWASYDHCATRPTTTRPNHSVVLATYTKCRGSVQVVLRTIIGGVHRWTPGIGEIVAAAFPWS